MTQADTEQSLREVLMTLAEYEKRVDASDGGTLAYLDVAQMALQRLLDETLPLARELKERGAWKLSS